MNEPISFEIYVREPLRIEAKLGERLVGLIEEYPTQYLDKNGFLIRAHFKVLLPGWPTMPHPVSSVTQARKRLLQQLSCWFMDAGPHCQELADLIGFQALKEIESDIAERAPRRLQQEDDDNARRSLHAANPR